jgi:hypothetical protein
MINDSATASTIAPPNPCSARAATRNAREPASPQAGEQQKASGAEQIGVDHPGERCLGELQVSPDRWQRHIDDRHVEHDHQHAEANHGQCAPTSGV